MEAILLIQLFLDILIEFELLLEPEDMAVLYSNFLFEGFVFLFSFEVLLISFLQHLFVFVSLFRNEFLVFVVFMGIVVVLKGHFLHLFLEIRLNFYDANGIGGSYSGKDFEPNRTIHCFPHCRADCGEFV